VPQFQPSDLFKLVNPVPETITFPFPHPTGTETSHHHHPGDLKVTLGINKTHVAPLDTLEIHASLVPETTTPKHKIIKMKSSLIEIRQVGNVHKTLESLAWTAASGAVNEKEHIEVISATTEATDSQKLLTQTLRLPELRVVHTISASSPAPPLTAKGVNPSCSNVGSTFGSAPSADHKMHHSAIHPLTVKHKVVIELELACDKAEVQDEDWKAKFEVPVHVVSFTLEEAEACVKGLKLEAHEQ
jgi:hypothetical protein